MTELTAPYWKAAREGRLLVQECQDCHVLRHPPLPRCPGCHGSHLGWREVSGEGTVYTYTVVRHPTHFAFADKVPYVLAIVELAEGPRLVSALAGVEPDEVRVGSQCACCSARSPTGSPSHTSSRRRAGRRGIADRRPHHDVASGPLCPWSHRRGALNGDNSKKAPGSHG